MKQMITKQRGITVYAENTKTGLKLSAAVGDKIHTANNIKTMFRIIDKEIVL